MHITIDLNDNFWPELQIVVNDGMGGVRSEKAMYDIAVNKFEPLVRDPVRKTIDSIIKRRKGKTNPT